MRLVTFEGDAGPKLGAIVGDHVLDLGAAATLRGMVLFPATMQALIEAGEKGLDNARTLTEAAPCEAMLAAPRLLSPLPKPIRLRDCCLFLEHMEVSMGRILREQAMAAGKPEPQPDQNGKWLNKQYYKQVIYYNADNLHIHGTGDDIHWPVQPGWADFELEWACVVGTDGRDLTTQNARDHIFGYTIFNDWSARDIQFPFMEAGLGPGEAKDFANCLGPCIATVDEFDDPYNLTMTSRVNGETWATGSTGTMHHSFEDAMVQFSRGKTLFAGEVFGSGTVLGGCGLELERELAHGDIVELEIDGIGTMRNRVLFPEGA